MEDKKLLNENELEKVSGGDGGLADIYRKPEDDTPNGETNEDLKKQIEDALNEVVVPNPDIMKWNL